MRPEEKAKIHIGRCVLENNLEYCAACETKILAGAPRLVLAYTTKEGWLSLSACTPGCGVQLAVYLGAVAGAEEVGN